MIPLTQEQAHQLQEGDKLVCIHMEEGYNDKLEIGKDYTVDSFENTWVRIKETWNSYGYRCFALPDAVPNSEQKGVTNMRDEVIDLEGSTIEQRRELANLLVDLGETLYNLETLLSGDYKTYVSCQGVWLVYRNVTPTIEVHSFINKYTRPTLKDEPSTKCTTKVVISISSEKFEEEVSTLEKEGYNILPETFLINDRRYTILMKLTKPKETPCLQL